MHGVQLRCTSIYAQVESVTPDTSAIEAMALMSDKHISSVAIVDPAGKLIGNFSVSEMR